MTDEPTKPPLEYESATRNRRLSAARSEFPRSPLVFIALVLSVTYI